MRPAARHLPALTGAALAALAGAAPAVADDFAERQAACVPEMTVVHDDCSVVNHYLCADGRHYLEGYREGELAFQEVNGPDYRLGPARIAATGEGWLRILETERDFSLAELLRDGRTSGAYLVELRKVFPAPRPGRVLLEATLTDETRELGGRAFRVARLSMQEEIGTGGAMASTVGPLLIDEERDLLFTDYATYSFAGVTRPTSARVADVLFAGEPGFMTTGDPPSCQGLLSLLAPRRDAAHG